VGVIAAQEKKERNISPFSPFINSKMSSPGQYDKQKAKMPDIITKVFHEKKKRVR